MIMNEIFVTRILLRDLKRFIKFTFKTIVFYPAVSSTSVNKAFLFIFAMRFKRLY